MVEKFSDRKTRDMQAYRQAAAGNENSVNFRKRFLNVHVRRSNGGNHAIETLTLERQAFPCALATFSPAA